MKYREVMKEPGLSKKDKERNFILLMRDKFLGMADDIVLVEKHVELLKGMFPFKGQKAKKGEILEIDEPKLLRERYPEYSIVYDNATDDTGKKITPPLSERMLMTMGEIPNMGLRLQCCESMMTLSKRLDETVEGFVKQMGLYTEVYQLLVKNTSFNNVLR